MSREETLAQLAALQQEFGAMLRTPLDGKSGTLRAQTARYSAWLCQAASAGARLAGPDRLAVYNRQYWFRLFSLLQREYLLSARLVGMWSFNELAAQYLNAHPPSHYDLQRAAPGFAPFLTALLAQLANFEGVPSTALLEAASIDAALSRVFLAPETAPLKPAALVAAELPQRRLQQAESVALVREHWPLVNLRRRAQNQAVTIGSRAESRASTQRLALPPVLEAPQHWLIMRKGQGHLYVQLPALAHRLYTLLSEHPVGAALGQLEQACSEAERRTLPAQVQSWLRQGMEHELWVDPA